MFRSFNKAYLRQYTPSVVGISKEPLQPLQK
ncbi:hypothetical protein LPIBR_10249 [Lacticaseibacillus paracasei]|nr:hypothetical protein LPIBR_10249 [Lacticaseibacillus paracasei]